MPIYDENENGREVLSKHRDSSCMKFNDSLQLTLENHEINKYE